MNEFVASNGVKVTLINGELTTHQINGTNRQRVQALREFFLAERDAELGRWRSKEHPQYVVYAEDGDAYVVNEEHGGGLSRTRGAVGEDKPSRVAREFFAVHPERKPWLNAKPGEKWLLTVYGAEHEFFIRSDGGSQIFAHRLDASAEYKLTGDTGVITAGRRIWPEEQGVVL